MVLDLIYGLKKHLNVVKTIKKYRKALAVDPNNAVIYYKLEKVKEIIEDLENYLFVRNKTKIGGNHIKLDDLGINETEVISFLKECCKANIGFYGQIPEVSKPVAPTTSTILLALHYSNKLNEDERQKWLSELIKFQIKDEGNEKFSFCNKEGSSVWATAWSIWAFFELQDAYKSVPEIEKSVEWLINQSNDDGGWGFDKKSPSRPFYTFYALHSLDAAYKHLKWEKLKNKFEKGLEYILKSQINGKPGLWAKQYDISEPCPMNTAMSLMVLIENCKKYPTLIEKEIIDSGIIYFRNWLENEKNWADVRLDEKVTPLFYLHFFTPATLIILLEYGFPSYDVICLKLVNWFRENIRRYDQNSIGWSGDLFERDGAPYSWATALSLIALDRWLKHLSKYDKISIIDYFYKDKDMSTETKSKLPDNFIELISKYRSKIKRLKLKEKIYIIIIFIMISHIVNILDILFRIYTYLSSKTLKEGIFASIIASIIIFLAVLSKKYIQKLWRRILHEKHKK